MRQIPLEDRSARGVDQNLACCLLPERRSVSTAGSSDSPTVPVMTGRTSTASQASVAVAPRSRGLRLAGEPIDDAIPPVPEEAFLDSIVQDARWCLSNIEGGPEVGWGRVPT